MTELIVALDGPPKHGNLFDLLTNLHYSTDVRWIKIGPQSIAHAISEGFTLATKHPFEIFLDLKLADTADTVRETVKRLADYGIGAISTFTDTATIAARQAAKGSHTQIWQVGWLTSNTLPSPYMLGVGDGLICPVPKAKEYLKLSKTIICPGVRFDDNFNGHKFRGTPEECVAAGVSYAVVGRPIWQSDDPIAATKRFITALKPGVET